MWRALLLVFLMVTPLLPALAQSAEDWKLCRGDDEKAGVPACTRLSNNAKLSKRERAEARLGLGLFYVKKDVKRGIEEFDKAIALDPGYGPAYKNRGRARTWLKDYDKAVADLTKAIELEPSNAEFYFVRAYAFYQQKQLDRALADYDRSIEFKPSAWHHIERGDVRVDRGEHDLAIADYRKAADFLTPGDDDDDKVQLKIVDRLIKTGKIGEAAYPIAKITDAFQMLRLRVLRTYEPLWSNATTAAAMATKARQARKVTIAEQAVAKNPRSLYWKVEFVKALAAVDRLADAERVGYEALATFSDHDDGQDDEPWLRQVLADSLVKRKFDRAQAIFEPVVNGYKAGRQGYLNNILNYSSSLLKAGRFREAAATAQLVIAKQVSSYGALFRKETQACSAAGLGRKSEAQTIAVEMTKSFDEAKSEASFVVTALICAGLEDQAAAILVKNLKHEPAMLLYYARCHINPEADPFDQERDRKLLELFDRPEVRSVVDPIGRVRGC